MQINTLWILLFMFHLGVFYKFKLFFPKYNL